MSIKVLSDKVIEAYESYLINNNKTFRKMYQKGFDLSSDPYKKLFVQEDLQFEDINGLNMKSEIPNITENIKTTDDYENSKKVFLWLKNMSLADANDKRLWITLTHTYFQEYTRNRWSIQKNSSDDVIKSRYFYSGSGLQARLRNSVSRLWWIAKLTWRPDLEDEFVFTKIAWSSQDLMQNLFERSFCTYKGVRFGMLRFYKDNSKVYSDTEFRIFYKELNALGATKPLVLMTEEDVYDFLKKVEKLFYPQNSRKADYSTFKVKAIARAAEPEKENYPDSSINGEKLKEQPLQYERRLYIKKIVAQDIERTPSISKDAAVIFFNFNKDYGEVSYANLLYRGIEKMVSIKKRKTRSEYRIFLNQIRSSLGFDLHDIIVFEKKNDGYSVKILNKERDWKSYSEFESFLAGENHLLMNQNCLNEVSN